MSLKSLLSPVGVLRFCLPPFLHSGVSSPSQDTPPCTQDRLTAEKNTQGQKCAKKMINLWSTLGADEMLVIAAEDGNSRHLKIVS